MTTVTGLTADRMLAIEAASVVDGDVDASGNLILTQKGGGQINAGSVIGPQGPQGPVGSMLSVITAQPVLDVGIINQIRAGRQLSPGDFGNMGLSAPIGLWNLSDNTDASGNGRNLSNKGSVGFDIGINGIVNTAARFLGQATQALYIPDTGAADPFRIKTGSWGCWFRTAKSGMYQCFISKYAGSSKSFYMQIDASTSTVLTAINLDNTSDQSLNSMSTVCDDRWHHAVSTFDGSIARIYLDGILENVKAISGTIFPSTAPLNIGSVFGDASTPSASFNFGRVDEVFITSDILSEDQVRNLYSAKIPHTLAAVPARFTTNIRRRRRGAALVASDFPSQPLRLHNFSAGSLGDEGSNGAALTNGGATSVAGVDGSSGNAFNFLTSASQTLAATDAGLPSGLAARSYGCWVKTNMINAFGGILSWGTIGTGEARLDLNNTNPSNIRCISSGDVIQGPVVSDGIWHFVVAVEDNGAIDGVKRKLYVDGRFVGGSTVLNPITLAGLNHFRIASNPDGSTVFTGQIDGVFICNYALTPEQITMLHIKSLLTLSPSPKNPGDHIEGADANNLLAIFDTLESNAQVDLKVAS